MEELLNFFNFNYKTYSRYWWQGENRFLIDPKMHTSFNAKILTLAASLSSRGRVLDVGAGEGPQSIRLAKMGFQVDAIELSPIGCEKIEKSAASEGVRVNVINGDFLMTEIKEEYDIVLCNGVLHYTDKKEQFLAKIKSLTVDNGYNIISSFTDFTPVPLCHKIVNVFPDAEKGSIFSAYKNQTTDIVYQRNKLENSHTEFGDHVHSFIKLISSVKKSNNIK